MPEIELDEDLREEHEPVHKEFGLSYTSYLVVPRVVLQSMPVWWQRLFIHLMRQIDKILDYEDGDWCVLRCRKKGMVWDEAGEEELHCTETCPVYEHDHLSEYRHNSIPMRPEVDDV